MQDASLPLPTQLTSGRVRCFSRSILSRRVYIPKPDGRQRPIAVAALKARWICEQAHQQLKEELVSTTSRGDPRNASNAMRSWCHEALNRHP